jgi:hypothetical protein
MRNQLCWQPRCSITINKSLDHSIVSKARESLRDRSERKATKVVQLPLMLATAFNPLKDQRRDASWFPQDVSKLGHGQNIDHRP